MELEAEEATQTRSETNRSFAVESEGAKEVAGKDPLLPQNFQQHRQLHRCLNLEEEAEVEVVAGEEEAEWR